MKYGGSSQNQSASPLNVDLCETYLIYRVDKGLGIVARELFDHSDLVMI